MNFDADQLTTKLAGLSFRGRVAFALLCCERLLPNYRYFSKKFAWGSPQPIRKALDYAWRYLEDANTPRPPDELIQECEAIIPDSEDFDTIFVSSAMDAGVCAIYLLELLRDDRIKSVVNIAGLCVDTVDMYVQELEEMDPQNPSLEERIRTHPLMQKELILQADHIEMLDSMNLDHIENVNTLKEKFHGQQQSNIELGYPSFGC